ncbi:MAG: alpha/beta hydrolase [bacterium]|nr:alpha/beta hydrolase [bacterium]
MKRALPTVLILTLAAALAAAAPGADTATPAFDPVGSDMVLIHGLGSDASVWKDVLPHLQLGFRVWTYEIPGHGRTPPLKDATIATVAADLGRFLAAEGIHTPVLVGHGFGGMVAMTYALDHPQEVRRLVMIDAAPRQSATREAKAQVAEQLAHNYDAYLAGYYGLLSKDQAIADRVVDQALRTEQITFTQLLLNSFAFDLSDELNDQDIPILVIGSDSLLPEPERAHEYLSGYGYAGARTISFKTMPGVGHYVMLEEPDYTATVIAAFALQR